MPNARRSFLAAGALTVALLALPAPVSATPNSAADSGSTRPVRPVVSVDLQRYSGRWLQLAAIPSPFEAQCVSDVTANYTVLPDGLVKVINSCLQADGTTSSLEGRARVVDTASNAKLQVTFVQIAGAWQFQFGGDYWILGLSSDYNWAVVGDPARKNGFVLSRKPLLSLGSIIRVVGILLRNGYSPCDFTTTPTAGGLPVARGLCSVATH
jgi:apolipoprotein D and lipocalin family protein